MPNALSNKWQQIALAAVAAPSAAVPLRVWLRGWAQGLDALAASQGERRPESIRAPATWSTDVGSIVAEELGTDTTDAIRGWEAWYEPTASRRGLPPLSILDGGTPASSRPLSWADVRERVSTPEWRAFTTAEASRWREALAGASRLPTVAGNVVRDAERTARNWWTTELAANPGRFRAPDSPPPPPPPATPPPPPPPPPATRPASSSAATLFAVALASVVGASLLRRRR